MANRVDSTITDAALLSLKSRAQRLVLLSGSPTAYAQLASTTLGSAPLTTDSFGEPLDGIEAQARRLTVNTIVALPVATGGDADHIAIVNDSEQRILFLRELKNAQRVVAGSSLKLLSFWIEQRGLSA